ncbi:Na+/H+ antiporter NhaC family protein [Natranaerobius trueperi]|uniref:Sodium:proton antiporter n=1 Tax=Natranaerobius trueperi TaxID=759412 RepID=A0A226C0S0_9FIRM|nr:Na+/H+ antiporter NhaC family protein [Natranaerobius trueperi]OWZ84761.1 sodium:proton antiporter [Natranaerobius trueperi]
MDFGIYSLLPPLVAIILAILTKQVLLSLFVGVWLGATMLSSFNPIVGIVSTFEDHIFIEMADPWNTSAMLSTIILGAFSAILERGGGAKVFGDFLKDRIKTRKQGLLLTWAGGVTIFFCDVTNPVIVGPIFRPITDFLKISREKLAYLLDSTSAPVSLLVPFSTWGAYVIGIVGSEFSELGYDANPLDVFIKAIPYQFYAISALIATLIISFKGIDFGPMKQAEKRACNEGKLIKDGAKPLRAENSIEVPSYAKPTIWNILAPLGVLLILIFSLFIWTGGYPEVGLFQAIGNADVMLSLNVSFFIASIVGVLVTVKSKVFTFKEATETWLNGTRQMMDAILILILAWSIGSVTEGIGTADYIVSVTEAFLTPAVMLVSIFVASALAAFSTGTSWGTFAIFLPISISLASSIDASMAPSIAAVLSGGLFGDHCSPISDTTILSSMGASCDHIDHVNTQLPYAINAAIGGSIGFLIAGITKSFVLPLITTFVFTILALVIFSKIDGEVSETRSKINELNTLVKESTKG